MVYSLSLTFGYVLFLWPKLCQSNFPSEPVINMLLYYCHRSFEHHQHVFYKLEHPLNRHLISLYKRIFFAVVSVHCSFGGRVQYRNNDVNDSFLVFSKTFNVNPVGVCLDLPEMKIYPQNSLLTFSVYFGIPKLSRIF